MMIYNDIPMMSGGGLKPGVETLDSLDCMGLNMTTAYKY